MNAQQLLVLYFSFMLSLGPISLSALPSGASYDPGQVSIANGVNRMDITAANNAVINYQGFNIAGSETVQFHQPSSSARVLNRVNGLGTSQINGQLLANGQVYLVNPSGVIFGNGAYVDVGALHAVAGNLSDSDFLSGINRFTNLNDAVVNNGTIEANKVFMIGKFVENGGRITSNGGIITLAAGKEVLVSESGSAVFANLGSGEEVERIGVKNSGEIRAPGGKVSLLAGDIYGVAINNSGTIEAADVVFEVFGNFEEEKVVVDETTEEENKENTDENSENDSEKETLTELTESTDEGFNDSAVQESQNTQKESVSDSSSNDSSVAEDLILQTNDSESIDNTEDDSSANPVEKNEQEVSLNSQDSSSVNSVPSVVNNNEKADSPSVTKVVKPKRGRIQLGGTVIFTANAPETNQNGSFEINALGSEIEFMNSVNQSEATSVAGLNANENTSVLGNLISQVSVSINADTLSLDQDTSLKASNVVVDSDAFTNDGQISVDGFDQGGVVSVIANTISAGDISADGDSQGGSIDLQAQELILAGNLSATSSNGIGGEVFLSSKVSSEDKATSRVDVSGKDEGGIIRHIAENDLVSSGVYDASSEGAGGQIDITAENGKLQNASLNVSGDEAGGLIRVGGEFQGGKVKERNENENTDNYNQRIEGFLERWGELDSLSSSDQFFIDRGSRIDVSSSTGDGGTAIVWADSKNSFAGQLSASGDNNGGFIELSQLDGGLEYISLAQVETGATEILLDPKDINIQSGALQPGGYLAANDTFAENSIVTASITVGDLTAQLNAGTAVTLQANNSIGVYGEILVNNPAGNGGALTLQAGRSIFINQNITTDNGNLNLYANETLANGVIKAQRTTGGATITIASGKTLNAGTGTVDINLKDGAGIDKGGSKITLSNITAANLNVTNTTTANGNIEQQTGSTINISGNTTLTTAGFSVVSLPSATNDFNNLSATTAALSLTDVNAITLGTVTASGLTLNTGGDISNSGALQLSSAISDITINAGTNNVSLFNGGNDFMNAVNLTAGSASILDKNALELGAVSVTGNLSLESTNGITQSSAISVGGDLSLSNGFNDITLTNTGNTITNLGLIDRGAAVSIVDSAGGLTIKNNIAGVKTNDVTIVTTGNLTINSGVQVLTTGAGNDIILAANDGAFINNAGASVLSSGSRHTIYAKTATTTGLNGITGDKTYNVTYPADPAGSGNNIYISDPVPSAAPKPATGGSDLVIIENNRDNQPPIANAKPVTRIERLPELQSQVTAATNNRVQAPTVINTTIPAAVTAPNNFQVITNIPDTGVGTVNTSLDSGLSEVFDNLPSGFVFMGTKSSTPASSNSGSGVQVNVENQVVAPQETSTEE